MVAEDYRRRGAGTALMEAAEERGRARGAVVAVTYTHSAFGSVPRRARGLPAAGGAPAEAARARVIFSVRAR
ncbi:GNAT family N-acetyltransferase [Actinoallomurus oryzae]|uniref:GNAT family N-acetyltransferase n=1 Tax=Actinoallomurus oryzae TaxID=502180 RepID=UPI003CD0A1C3